MSEIRIYKLDLSASDVSETAAYVSSNHGGAGTPYTETEIARLENIYRQETAGANGQHVLNAIDMEDFTVSWVNLCEVGNLTSGEYDCRGGGAGHPLKVRWQQYFSSSALNETGTVYPLVLAHGGASTHPSASGDIFLEIQMLQDTGANFDWFCRYRKKVNSTNTSSLTGTNITGIADVADDAEHQCILTIIPSTVTGVYDGAGGLGSSTIVASDGHISLAVGDYDGTNMQTVLSGSGLQFIINHLATTNPALYYGKGVWHGIM